MPERELHGETARARRVVDNAPAPHPNPLPASGERERTPAPSQQARYLLAGALQRGEQAARRGVGVGGVGA